MAACGGHARAVSHFNAKDSALAHRTLARQLRSLRVDVRGPLRKAGVIQHLEPICGRRPAGVTARARSPLLSYKRTIQFAVEDIVFPRAAGARRVIQHIEGHAAESCLARLLPQKLRRSQAARGIHVGAAAVSAAKVVNAGDAAVTFQISVAAADQGHRFLLYAHAFYVSQGRMVVALLNATIGTDKSIFPFDLYMARAFAADAKEEQS